MSTLQDNTVEAVVQMVERAKSMLVEAGKKEALAEDRLTKARDLVKGLTKPDTITAVSSMAEYLEKTTSKATKELEECVRRKREAVKKEIKKWYSGTLIKLANEYSAMGLYMDREEFMATLDKDTAAFEYYESGPDHKNWRRPRKRGYNDPYGGGSFYTEYQNEYGQQVSLLHLYRLKKPEYNGYECEYRECEIYFDLLKNKWCRW